MEISNKKFRNIPDYDPVTAFKYNFGIINGTGELPQRIVLSFTPTEGRCINSLLLHHSQVEIINNEQERCFEYHLVSTYDLKMELLSYGDTLKVLEPESLQEDLVKILSKTLQRYREKKTELQKGSLLY